LLAGSLFVVLNNNNNNNNRVMISTISIVIFSLLGASVAFNPKRASEFVPDLKLRASAQRRVVTGPLPEQNPVSLPQSWDWRAGTTIVCIDCDVLFYYFYVSQFLLRFSSKK
jgi:hypothetical protein